MVVRCVLPCAAMLAAAAFAASTSPLSAAETPISIDASTAVRITLPNATSQAASFTTPDGKQGWVVRLSNQAIPTPAYVNGRILTGSGMSASQFMALDSVSGKTLWAQTTTDNGPTSPVVIDKYVCYNTESCDTECRDIDSGEMVWHQTTGGSLLTQTVLLGDMLIVPHPTMARTAHMSDDSFRMLAVNVKTGKHVWDRNISADIFSAPVGVGTRLFFSCVDGRLFCENFGNQPGWHVTANAISAPAVLGEACAVSTQAKTLTGSIVGIQRFNIYNGVAIDSQPLAPTSVANAVLSAGQRAEWDYQGPKVVASSTRLFNAPGLTINSVDAQSGVLAWRAVVRGTGLSNAVNAVTPPALGKKNLYLGTGKGHILTVKQSDGSLVSAYNLGVPLASPPILAEGSIYFGTANGLLVCLKLNDPDAKDWHAWGGDETHNKVQ
jgi:outer membrane protein assembly factor BamB